jgi:hypothetical protein
MVGIGDFREHTVLNRHGIAGCTQSRKKIGRRRTPGEARGYDCEGRVSSRVECLCHRANTFYENQLLSFSLPPGPQTSEQSTPVLAQLHRRRDL